MTRKLLTEVIGTFFLVLTIGLVVTTASPMAPLAIGAALMVMVYMGGAVSGAHYNPAVTLAVLMRRKIAAGEAAAYVVAQLAGATLAAFTVYAIVGKTFVPAPGPGVSAGTALLVEALFTFALALVVLNVATTRAGEGNSYFGLAIGFTVAAGAFAGGPVSGGAFNPAVGLGPAIVTALLGSDPVSHVWLYVVGPLLGAALAAVVFRVQHPLEFGPVATPRLAGVKQPEDVPAPVAPRA
jgi:aquaporin Z